MNILKNPYLKIFCCILLGIFESDFKTNVIFMAYQIEILIS